MKVHALPLMYMLCERTTFQSVSHLSAFQMYCKTTSNEVANKVILYFCMYDDGDDDYYSQSTLLRKVMRFLGPYYIEDQYTKLRT